MRFNPTITLLLASLAAAAPASVESQPQQEISVWLNAHIITVIEEVELSTDGVRVAPDSPNRYIANVMVECRDKCDQEYHCTLYDENLAAFKTVLPGNQLLEPPQTVSQVSCQAGIPLDLNLPVIEPELPRPES